MIIYVVYESYKWYKGADATFWGAFKSKEDAIKALMEIIDEKFDYIKDLICCDTEEEEQQEWEKWVNERFTSTDKTEWMDEDDDAVTKFYVESYTMED